MQQSSNSLIADKEETIRGLERQLDEARRKNENDKSSQQMTYQEILGKMESKYRGEITSLSQEVAKRSQEAEYMAKENERAIK